MWALQKVVLPQAGGVDGAESKVSIAACWPKQPFWSKSPASKAHAMLCYGMPGVDLSEYTLCRRPSMPAGDMQFQFHLQRATCGQLLGVTITHSDGHMDVTAIGETGIVPEQNNAILEHCPDVVKPCRLCINDRIVGINGYSDGEGMMRVIREATQMRMTVQRTNDRLREVMMMHFRGGPVLCGRAVVRRLRMRSMFMNWSAVGMAVCQHALHWTVALLSTVGVHPH